MTATESSPIRAAVISGAAQGIGREAALLLARRGINRFVLLDRNGAQLGAVSNELRQFGAQAQPCEIDLRDREATRSCLHTELGRIGHVEVLINNAGVADENEPDDEEKWQWVLDLNLHAAFRVTAACLPFMVEAGRIVNVASILGRGGKIRNTAYCASKHGLLGYTKALALDLAMRRITVNAILPGWVDTPMLQRELASQASQIGTDPKQILRNARKTIPLRRFVEASEAAELIGFLCSSAAASITAQSFTIDGGYTCGM